MATDGRISERMRALLLFTASAALAQTPWDRVEALRQQLTRFRDREVAAQSLISLGEAVQRVDADRGAAMLWQAAELNAPRSADWFLEKLRRAADLVESSSFEEAADALDAAARGIWSFEKEELEGFASVLLRLQQGERSRADELFSHLVQELATDAARAAPRLSALGNYVFGPPGEPFRIERSGNVHNLRGSRPGASGLLRVAYLEVAGATLRVNDGALARELGRELRPHWGLLQDSPSSLMARFYRYWARRQAAEAREVASEVIDIRLRRRLDLLAAFAEGAAALDAGETEWAATVSGRMPPGAHKTLLHFAFGERDWLFLALREASDAPVADRPGLLVIAARILREGEPEVALRAFEQAMDAFNAAKAVNFTRSAFYETVERRTFTLTLDGIPSPDLAAAAAELAPLDPDRVWSILQKLKNEARLGPALVAAVTALIS